MRKLLIALAIGAALLPFNGFSLGLGEIEVNSALNQELDAEIKLLSAAPEDTETLIVRLASREEFSRAGLDRPALLLGLKFGTEIREGVPYLTITSNKPIREPFLNFLVEVDWPKGHLLREYTILLDPPVFLNEQSARPSVSNARGTGPAPVTTDNTSSRPGADRRPSTNSFRPAQQTYTVPPQSQESARPLPSQQSAAPQPSRSAPVATTYTAPARGGNYRIKQGDTAWSLADELRPDQSVSIEQMMLALLRTNPESFINGNVNGLKRGFILRVPERSEIAAVSQTEAVALVRQQHALWREYQQTVSLAGPAPGAAKTNSSKPATNNQKASDARLSIVSAGRGAATGATGDTDAMSATDLRAQLALVEERLESERLEKESLQGDVKALEQQVNKMKRLLSIEDSSLAQMQSSATPSTADPATATESKTVTESAPVVPDTSLDITDADLMLGEEDPSVTSAPAPDAADTESENVFVDEQTVTEQNTGAQENLPDNPVVPVSGASSDDLFAQDNELTGVQALVARLMANPLFPAALGAGVLLLMSLVYLLVKRRRSNKHGSAGAASAADFMDDDLASVADMLDDDMGDTHISDSDTLTSSASGGKKTEKFDSDATLISSGADDASISPAGATDDEARDDIIAEADVYLAYGIYQQAEELLQNAIKDHDDNDAYRMKLVETYFAGKNVSAFGELATQMHKRTNGKGSRWQKIVTMGKELIPGHALFNDAAGGATSEEALDDIASPSESTMDFDLDLDDTAVSEDNTELDFSLDDTASLDDAADIELENDSATDSGLEFDLGDAVVAEPETEADMEEEFSLDIEASELDISDDEIKSDDATDSLDFDLDLSAEAAADDD